MARDPAALAVACPLCGAQPGEPCTRRRPAEYVIPAGSLKVGDVLRIEASLEHDERVEPIRPHSDRKDALTEQNCQTRTIR